MIAFLLQEKRAFHAVRGVPNFRSCAVAFRPHFLAVGIANRTGDSENGSFIATEDPPAAPGAVLFFGSAAAEE